MESYQSITFNLNKNDILSITDQKHIDSVTLHKMEYTSVGGFSIILTPAHAPALLHAIEVLLLYATPKQRDDLRKTIRDMVEAWGI